MSWTATRDDLITLGGLPASAYVADSRELADVHVASSTFELPGHGFGGGPRVRFAARSGSANPTGIDPLAWYPVAVTDDPDFFTLTCVTLSDAGSGKIFCVENIWPKIDRRLRSRTSWVVANAKAYAGPWTTPPEWAPQLVATLVAFDVAVWLRLSESRFDVEGVKAAYAEAQEFIRTKLDAGAPYPDGIGPIDATPDIADMGAELARPRVGAFDLMRCGEDIA